MVVNGTKHPLVRAIDAAAVTMRRAAVPRRPERVLTQLLLGELDALGCDAGAEREKIEGEWTAGLGAVDLWERKRGVGESDRNTLAWTAELKVGGRSARKLDEALWDFLKMASALNARRAERAFLVSVATPTAWERCEVRELFPGQIVNSVDVTVPDILWRHKDLWRGFLGEGRPVHPLRSPRGLQACLVTRTESWQGTELRAVELMITDERLCRFDRHGWPHGTPARVRYRTSLGRFLS